MDNSLDGPSKNAVQPPPLTLWGPSSEERKALREKLSPRDCICGHSSLTLAPMRMANAMDDQIVIRIPKTLTAQLRKYAEILEAEQGLPVSQAAALRRLIIEGLQQAGLDIPPPPKRKRAATKAVKAPSKKARARR